MKLSIIIPVYNVEKYLYKCLNSCLEQNVDVEKYEVIIVNDGSSDNSLDVINSYAERSNIHVISQKNAGLSAARNTGLKSALGEYVWFVDSDDWIESGILECVFRELSLTKLDCLSLGYRKVTNDGKLLGNAKLIEGNYGLCQDGMSFLKNELGFSFYAWVFVFNRLFLKRNSFFFKEGIVFEDLQLIPRILRKASHVKSLSLVAYYYRQRKDSLVNIVNEKMLNSVFCILDDYHNYIIDITNEREKRYFILLLNRVKIMFLVLLSNFEDITKKSEYKCDFYMKYPSVKILNGMLFKEKVCAVIYNTSPRLLYLLFDIKKKLKCS